MKQMFLLVTIAMSFGAEAKLLNRQPGTQSIAGVAVATSASIQADNQSVDLGLVGAGLRDKKVLFSDVKVYVGELFSDDPNKFARNADQALPSLDGVNTVGCHMTFLHSVSGEQMMGAFQKGFEVNGIDATSAPLAALLQAISDAGDLNNNDTMAFVIRKNSDGTEDLLFENQKGAITTIKGDRGLTGQVGALWLGKTTDSGASNLKNQIINGSH